MQYEMVKEGRTGVQVVYSERDLQWLLKQGWSVREKPVAALLKHASENSASGDFHKRKPGRPRKAAVA